MNARLYDANLHRFLAPDNFVQDPYNTQNYNRYSYAFNNPLSYVDLDGNNPLAALLIKGLIGAAIAVTTNGIINTINNQPFFQNVGIAAIGGFVGGAMSSFIGNTAGQLSGFGKFAFQTFAHAHLGGVMNGLTGSDYLSGFISGGTASIVAGGTGKWLKGVKNSYLRAGGITLSGAVSGGAASVAVGGNFWDGFRNGMISAGLNHAAHSGLFGKGLAIVMITGRLRHFVGSDAVSLSISGTVDGIASVGMEGGGLAVLVGPDAGFDTISDIGLGVGTVDASLTLELTELYHTGRVSDIRLEDFYGSRGEINLGIGAVASFGRNFSYAKVGNSGYKIYGSGISFGVGVSATIVSGNINWGASGRNLKHVRELIQKSIHGN